MTGTELQTSVRESRLHRTARTAGARRWWRELFIAAALYAGYDIIRGLIAGNTARAMRDGRDILNLERLLHIDPERYLNRALDHLAPLAVPACFFYATLHFIITPAVLIWTYLRHREAYRRARTVLAVITLTALVGFWLFPTAPPRLLTGAGFQDTLVRFGSWGWWGSDASVPTAAHAIANPYAAMPSLHLAWAVWCGATVYSLTRRRAVRAAAVAYPILTALVVIGTANHYLLDVIAGAAVWGLADRLVSYVPVSLRRSPARPRVDLGGGGVKQSLSDDEDRDGKDEVGEPAL